MPTKDTSMIKEKMISAIKFGGPKLPVHIARETGMSILFSSAFLSELISEKRLKMSYMRVGSSPIYYIPGQEAKLENWANHLHSKEKDAFEILKQKRILRDRQQEPAIRVALRSIKDFAFPFEREGELYWRYFITPEPPIQPRIQQLPKPIIQEERIITQTIKETPREAEKVVHDKLGIFEKEEKKEEQEVKKPVVKKTTKKTTPKKSQKAEEKFFNQVKESLIKEGVEILGIEGFSKNEIILKIKKNGREEILVAYNKQKIGDSDIIKASKKAEEFKLPYSILSKKGILKKVEDLVSALRRFSGAHKIEWADKNL